MKIILTNDDGFNHQGIKSLFRELDKKHEVFLIGPDQIEVVSAVLSLF